MIPPFDDRGYLPPGIHSATLDEIEARFGRESELRRVQFESLCWLVDLARRAGVLRLIVNGSFVTDAYEPNDIDCALLVGEDYPVDADANEELSDGLPFIEMNLVNQEDFNVMIEEVFASDREWTPKGMMEITL